MVRPRLEVRLVGRNQELIEDFIRSLGVLGVHRIRKYRYGLVKVSRDLGMPFEEVSRDVLKDFVVEVEGSDYEAWTKRDYRLVCKKFFGWLHDKEFVSWIRLGNVKSTVGPEDILSDVEFQLFRSACDNIRDKALVEALNESAFRPHEFLSLRKSSIVFDDYGAQLHVDRGKTGPRRIRVINAAPLLANWIENHPLKSKDAPLWVDLSNNASRHEAMSWRGLRDLVKRVAKKANIQKPATPYIFRHTRLTHLAKFMTEAQLCEFAGWEQGSDMPRMYVHLSGRDVDDALLKAYGLKKQEEITIAKAPRKCVRCGILCEASAETCSRCGMALTLTAAMKKDEELTKMHTEIEELKRLIHSIAEVPKESLQ